MMLCNTIPRSICTSALTKGCSVYLVIMCGMQFLVGMQLVFVEHSETCSEVLPVYRYQQVLVLAHISANFYFKKTVAFVIMAFLISMPGLQLIPLS